MNDKKLLGSQVIKIRSKRKPSLSIRQARVAAELARDSGNLLLLQVFDSQTIRRITNDLLLGQRVTRDRAFTPEITVGLFVQQALSERCGCQKIVHEHNTTRKRQGQSQLSSDSSSYCEARLRLPIALLTHLLGLTIRLAGSALSDQWLWHERRAILVDGLVTNAPDTPANQEAFPQTASQEPGLGFPQVRQLVSICLATGVVLDVKIGPVVGKKTGEASLFRQMMPSFERGDIIVADSNFECYRDLAALTKEGVDMVCEKNATRSSPFTGPCTCVEDAIVVLDKPAMNSSRFTPEEYAALPERLRIRIIRLRIGGRKGEITLVTTLTDQKRYPTEDIAALYKARWNCELDIRSIKSVLGMGELSCRSPEMLRREIIVYYLAYNLIRVSMIDAAKIAKCEPRELSFKNAKNAWLSYVQHFKQDADAFTWLLSAIATVRVRDRPDRHEPRAVKRRHAKYPRLKIPRNQAKQALQA